MTHNGTLKTAAALTNEQVLKLEKGFSEKLAMPVRFEVVVDKSIIGGFVATIDGVVYDASFKAQLETIGKMLKS